MQLSHRPWLTSTAMVLMTLPALAQSPTPAGPTPLPPPKADTAAAAVAATVNGQPVPESMLQRSLERILPDKRAEARPELLNFLIDTMLIDQHLLQMNVAVEKKETDKRLDDMKAELKKQNKDFGKVLQELKMTEAELCEYMTASLRWDKYANSQATDKALSELFEANKEMFDGTMVRARHILLTPAPGDTKSAEQAPAQLAAYKKEIEDKVTAGLAKLPANSDNLTREKARNNLMDEAFAATARDKSMCPSKNQGGDVNWFQRAGFMVEPFAKTAFALKPYQISDVVKSQFGYHLIMVTDRKPGREVKFEDAKDEVKEVFTDRLHENLAAQMRARAKIVITPVKP